MAVFSNPLVIEPAPVLKPGCLFQIRRPISCVEVELLIEESYDSNALKPKQATENGKNGGIQRPPAATKSVSLNALNRRAIYRISDKAMYYVDLTYCYWRYITLPPGETFLYLKQAWLMFPPYTNRSDGASEESEAITESAESTESAVDCGNGDNGQQQKKKMAIGRRYLHHQLNENEFDAIVNSTKMHWRHIILHGESCFAVMNPAEFYCFDSHIVNVK
jgi:hypothetical protein